MIRRDFLIRSGILSAGALIGGKAALTSCTSGKYGELSRHTINKVEFGHINYSWPRFVGKNGRIGRHGQHKRLNAVRLVTDQGAAGWGIARRINEKDRAALASLVEGKTLDTLFHPDAGM